MKPPAKEEKGGLCSCKKETTRRDLLEMVHTSPTVNRKKLWKKTLYRAD